MKILSFEDLILNNYYTKNYIDNELSKKYDDFNYDNGSIICFSNGEVKKRVPILSVENYYSKAEIDEKINEINNKLKDCIVDGEITSDNEGIYLIFN